MRRVRQGEAGRVVTAALFGAPAAAVEPVTIEVHGIPRPQGSKTAYVVKGRAVVAEAGNKTSRAAFHSWRDGITHAAQRWQDEHHAPVCDAPARITIVFRLPRPKSAPRKRVWPDTRPDLDKLARAVLDSLTGVLISDDSRVCELVVSKTFAADVPPGCTITLEVL